MGSSQFWTSNRQNDRTERMKFLMAVVDTAQMIKTQREEDRQILKVKTDTGRTQNRRTDQL
jgi:hypothetical protein